MSSQSKHRQDNIQINEYLVKHQGITKKLLFKWFSSLQNYSELRQSFWEGVEKKKNIFFHNLSKRVFFYDGNQYVIGKYFYNSRNNSAFVVETVNKGTVKEFKCAAATIAAIKSHDLVLIKKEGANWYSVDKIISAGVQWISGIIAQKYGEWVVEIQSFIIRETVFIQNVHDFPLCNGSLVSISNPIRQGKRLVVVVKKIISTTNSPQGRLAELCQKHNIKYEFDKEVIRDSKLLVRNKEKYDWFKGRIDLTKSFFVTIDSDDSKDLDDAICVVKKSENIYNLKVAIADVSNYLFFGNSLDQEARTKACSNYFSNIVYPMLPKRISNDICSLNCDFPKFVMVCDIDYDVQACDIVSFDVYHAIIQSKHQLSYSFVNETIANSNNHSSELGQFILNCQNLSLFIQKKFAESRHFTILRDELKIIIGNDNTLSDIRLSQPGEGEKIIENFMMLANHCVAKFMFKHNIAGIYRRHEKIKTDKLLQAWNIIQNIYPTVFNEHFSISNSSTEIYKSLHNYDAFIKKNKICILILFSFYETAYYSSFSGNHFGLGVNEYCHFTSPIRRYSDLYVHYVVSEYLYKKAIPFSVEPLPPIKCYDISELCFDINVGMRAARQCENNYKRIKQAEFLKVQAKFTVYSGLITNIFRGRIYLTLGVFSGGILQNDLGNDFFVEDGALKMLVGRGSKKKYLLGDKIKVVPKYINTNSGAVFWKPI